MNTVMHLLDVKHLLGVKQTSLVTTTAESTTNTEMVKTVQQEKNRPLRWSKLVSACQIIEQGTHAGCGIGQV